MTMHIYPDSSTLIPALADWLAAHIKKHMQTTSEPFSLALSGGNTPKPLYELLAKPEYARQINWKRVHLFWSDERFVPYDDPQSNYHMTRLALIDRISAHTDHAPESIVPLPKENIHFIPTDGTPENAAQRYTQALQDYYGASQLDPARPLFTVNLLGIGEDGHIASLFPGTSHWEENPWAFSVTGPKPPPQRISLSLPVLESAGTLIFLATGAGKSSAVAGAQAQDPDLPAGRLCARRLDQQNHLNQGQLLWFLDQAAAADSEPVHY